MEQPGDGEYKFVFPENALCSDNLPVAECPILRGDTLLHTNDNPAVRYLMLGVLSAICAKCGTTQSVELVSDQTED